MSWRARNGLFSIWGLYADLSTKNSVAVVEVITRNNDQYKSDKQLFFSVASQITGGCNNLLISHDHPPTGLFVFFGLSPQPAVVSPCANS